MQLDIGVDRVQRVKPNSRAEVAAYLIELDFGDEALTRRLKQSSAQLTDRYAPTDEEAGNQGRTGLMGRQLIAITHFPKRHIGVPSHFLILGVGAVREAERGTVVLSPHTPVHKGAKVVLFDRGKASISPPQTCTAYEDTLARLDLRVGRLIETDGQKMSVDFGETLGVLALTAYPNVRQGQ